MLARFGVTYPVGMDVDDAISARYGITGVPETFVVDAAGRVAYVHIGPVSADVLRRELDDVLSR
jgi:cytochrome c biogenesis protein CcmG/thiol:disulfide interchange protein DsbE